jgi:hypothetical protein
MTTFNPTHRVRVVLAWVFAGALLTTVGSTPAYSQPNANNDNEIETWNRIMLEAGQSAATAPFIMTRVAAIVQSAVYDAVNGIERRYAPIHVAPAAEPGASQRAAVVLAAYTTLVSIYPSQKTTFDKELAASLASIASGSAAEGSVSIARGAAWGQTVANAILAWRSTDGFTPPPPPFLGGSAPGVWRPTPPAFPPAAGVQFSYMVPWAIQSPNEFRPSGPPALTSLQYTTDFNEVAAWGSIVSPLRTPDQTLLAQFWQSATPNYLFDHAALQLAGARHATFSEESRLLAVLNVAMADADIACWEAKFHYVFWRPVTAIQFADTDGNPATQADPGWTPLLVTPAFPDYPSGHACLGGAAGTVLANYFGPGSPVSIVSDSPAMAGVVRSFSSFAAMMKEVNDARVLAGIHFRTAVDDGQVLGVAVAQYILENSMLPLNGNRTGQLGH